MDEQIKHVCNEVGIPRKSRLKMEEYGICTVEGLLKVKARDQRGELNGLREEVRAKLAMAAEWKLKNPHAEVVEDFDEDVYDKIYKDKRWAKEYIKMALGRPYREENFPLFNDVNDDDMLLEEVVQQCKNMIMGSSNLRNMCGKFDYDSFLHKAIHHFHSSIGQESNQEIKFVVAGRTQSGKTSVKGVCQSLCGLLKIPLVILTKGVDESINLHVKLVGLTKGTLMQAKHVVVASSKNDGLGYRFKDALVSEALEGENHGGTLVIADTKPQVLNKACKGIRAYRDKVPNGKFILVVDEADAMFRTRDRHQVFEQALQQLLDLGPSITVMISATPVPFMLELVHGMGNSEEDIEFFNLEPQDNYIGIEDIKPLEINNKKVYLDQNELNIRSEYTSNNVTICYVNDKVMALYDDALSDLRNRKGVLVLDCSCPRVYARNNIKDKANAVQRLYKKRGTPIIVITFSGSGIKVKYPRTIVPVAESTQPGKWKSWHNCLIGTLLQYIDDTCGLRIPVFIFGYSKMCRGISFRSNERVPTHMLMALGRGHNSSTIVQTLGRVTFNGRNVLKENGFECVRVLTTSSDYVLCKKKQNYIDTVGQRIQMGDTFAAAVTGANERIPDSANFMRHTFRELGRIKGMRKQFFDWVDVEDVPDELSPDEEESKEKFWNNTDAQKLMRSLARLRKGHPLVVAGDIMDDLEEAEHYGMAKKTLSDLLRKFCDKSLIAKDISCKDKDPRYKMPKVDRLVLFMNPEAGDVPEVPDGDEQSIASYNDGSPQRHTILSNASGLSSIGTKESPIILDSSDECSVSSISMTTVDNRRKTRSTAKVVSPEKDEQSMLSAPQNFVGKRIAKLFSSKLYFGRVEQYDDGDKLWTVKYDDGDGEEFDEYDLCEAIRLCKDMTFCSKPKSKRRRVLVDLT